MAKYCMFCGEEIPNNAQFCPSCGQKQVQKQAQPPKQTNNNYNLDDEDDEMDLLLKFGLTGNTISNPKKEEPKQKVITLDYKIEEKEDEKNSSENSTIIEPKKVIDEKTITIPSFLKNEEKKVAKEETIQVKENIIEKPIEKTIIPENNKIDEPENTSVQQEESNKSFFDDFDEDDFDLVEDEPINDNDVIIEEDEAQNIDENTSTPVNRHAARRRDLSTKKIVITAEDEEEETFSTSLNNNNKKNVMFSPDQLHADEKADIEKRKNIVVESDDEKKDDRSHLEGRKQQTQKIEKRRKSIRNYDEKKYYKIEQDKTDIDYSKDPSYDGYYENVLPIDHDQERTSKLPLKTILICLGIIVACGLLIYFSLTMLI